jgi:hypothetical protein
METTAPIIPHPPWQLWTVPAPTTTQDRPPVDWQPPTTQNLPNPASSTTGYWQPATPVLPEVPGLAGARERLVGLVAALVLEATIAALAVLPTLPAEHLKESGQPGFWMQFALVGSIAAAVISFAYGPGVGIRDLPWVARIFLALAFFIVPAAAFAAGATQALRNAGVLGAADLVSTSLTTAFFAVVFFGLPLVVLAAPGSHRRDDLPK